MEEVSQFWSRFWRTRVPDRAKCVVWRAYHNALPVFENLASKGIVSNLKCSLCGTGSESILHLFVNCQWAKALWELMGIKEWPRQQCASFVEWLWDVLLNEYMDARTIVVGIWIVWKVRCQGVFGRDSWTVQHAAFRAFSVLKQTELKGLVGYAQEESDEVSYSNSIDILCDGSFDKESGDGGFAAVALMGNRIIACSMGYSYTDSAKSLRLAKKLGHETVNFKSDNSEVVWAFQSGCYADDDVADILKEATADLCENKHWKIFHTFREYLRLADILARKARSEKILWSKEDALPIWLGDLIVRC